MRRSRIRLASQRRYKRPHRVFITGLLISPIRALGMAYHSAAYSIPNGAR